MKRYAQLLTSLYARLLALYPRRYRGEYGDELQTVFGSAAEEAAEDGLASLLRFSLHELHDLPSAALRQHMKERNKSKTGDETGELLAFKPASWREISLADIAAEAKGTLPQLHEAFRSKQAIIAALVDRMNLLFCQGAMFAATRTRIIQAIEAIPGDRLGTRVTLAAYLALCSPEGAVQR